MIFYYCYQSISQNIYLRNVHGVAGHPVDDAVSGPREYGDGATCTRHRCS